MRKCRGCKRETKDPNETVCIVCGWITDAVAEEQRVNSGRQRKQPDSVV